MMKRFYLNHREFRSVAKPIEVIARAAGWLLICSPFASSVFGADVGCIAELSVPSYTYIARRSPGGGTVRALVTIGPSSKAEKIEASGDPNLVEEVRSFLGEATTYVQSCAGKTIEIVFTFQLEGEAEWTPPVFVKFRPPNHFVIISRPKKPNTN